MVKRRGYGTGKGQGYLNLVPMDSLQHSLNAKGVKTVKMPPQRLDPVSVLSGKGRRYDFGKIPTPQKKGLIREIARKVHEKVDWAIQWEKDHLPKQRAWVKKEFEHAKDLAKKGAKKVKEKVEEAKKGWEEAKTEREFEKKGLDVYDVEKKKDLDDVRDELDTNDDGVQDLDMSDLDIANQEITQGLNQIDLDNSGVPDHIEDGTFDMPEPPRPSGAGFPLPSLDPQKEYGKEKEGVFKKGARFVKKQVEAGKHKIVEQRLQRDFIRSMTDAEVRQKAIEVGKPVFGQYNAFEKEIIRREQEKARLTNIVKQAKTGEIKKSAIDFGFLNPIGTLGKEPKKVTSKKAKKKDDTDYFGFINPIKTLKK